MPLFSGVAGEVYYRDWDVPDAVAGVVFGHGYGEHSGLFHRFAFALNQHGIRVWGIDAIGHGLSEGPRGVAPADALAANVLELTRIAERAAPGLPLVVAGHSMGSVAAALALGRESRHYRGAVLTGAPIEGFDPAILEDLDDVVMSRDDFYLDQLEHDPLEAWLTDAPAPDGSRMQAEAELWPLLEGLDVPVLLLNGEEDPIAPPAMARRAAQRCRDARTVVIEDGCHDIVNDAAHVLVAEHIATFVLEATST